MEREYAWTLPEQRGGGVEAWDEILERATAGREKEGDDESRRDPSNPASTYASAPSQARRLISKHGGAPWIPSERSYEPGSIGLHQEILDFVQWCKPTEHEFQLRMHVFRTLESLILKLWPQAKVDFFGSFRTRLFLPTSDIDMVVMGEWASFPLWTLEAAIRESGMAVKNSIKVLDKASVPIVKLTHAPTKINVDISFNMVNGVPSAHLISEYMQVYPVLPYLVYVLKYFLLERDLNEVFTGGLSSYSLILMTISFLQLHAARRLQAQVPEARRTNLAVLLLEWLELYGRHFNYVSTAIRLRPRPSYAPKDELQREMADGNRPSMLSIQDPLEPSNDIGRSCHGAMRVRQAFEYAFLTLSRALVTPAPHFSDHVSGSLLTRILRVTDAVIDYRAFLADFPLPIASNGDSHEDVPVSYAAVASSHLSAIARPSRVSKRSRANDSGPPSASDRRMSSSSEFDSDSESTSQSSDASGNSRRSYSSVASSNLPGAKPPRPASNSSAASSLPHSSSNPQFMYHNGSGKKPPSPAPSTDSTHGSSGHRNAYRVRRRNIKGNNFTSPRRGGKKSS